MVVISFKTNNLHLCCCEYAVAEATYGQLNAVALLTLIADIEATTNGLEIIDLIGSDAVLLDSGSIWLRFGSELYAGFIPVGTRFERDDAGRVRWETVSRLKLVGIERRS